MKKKILLSFTKMHGLGNDFIVIDNRQKLIKPDARQIQSISDRHFGIGCDQVLLIEHSQLEDIDFKYRIFNGNGTEVEQCGNGARCFARYVYEKGLTEKTTLAVETMTGIIYLYLETPDNHNQLSMEKKTFSNVKVNMGKPDFSPQALPFLAEKTIRINENLYQLENNYTFSAVSMGNPHITLVVKNVNEHKVKTIGKILERHPLFPQGVNVGFMQIIDTDNIALRVYERGAGETLACGSGACAAVVNGIQQGILNHQVKVQLTAGDLNIQWNGKLDQPVWMTGSASFVFEGQIEI